MLRKWVRRAETDEGLRPGLSSGERQRLKTLEGENRELRRARPPTTPTADPARLERCAMPS